MRRIRVRQTYFGGIWGFLAFAGGWLITWSVIPEGLISAPKWKVVSWFYLSANWVPIGVEQLPGIIQRVDLMSGYPEYSFLEGYPIMASITASILVSASLGYTERGRYILQNSLAIIIGYASTGIVVMFLSDARPSFNAVLILFRVFGGALVVGGKVLSSATGGLPYIGIASVGTVILIGLLVIFGGVVIVRAIIPLIVVPAIGAIIGAILLWSSRNAPI